MPNRPFPRAHKRRTALLAAAGTLGFAFVPSLIFAPAPAAATPSCVPASYTASSTADLIKITALDLGVLGLVPPPVANVTIGHATADMARTHANHARATADYLSATLAGAAVLSTLLDTHARQDAPPANAAPDEHSLLALHSGVLDLGIGNVKAAAGRPGPYSCGAAAGSASVAGAVVLPGSRGHSLLSLPGNLNGGVTAGLASASEHLTSTATAGAGLAELHLFGGTGAAIVITEPRLRGIATGDAATSSVTYTSPVLDVTFPDGNLDVVTAANAGAVTGPLGSLDVPVTEALPVIATAKTQLELRLTVGGVTKHVGATAVSGNAATLRLQVLLVPAGVRGGIVTHATTNAVTVADLGIGVLSVAATAPRAALPSPTPTVPSGGYGSPTSCASPAGYGYGGCTGPGPSPSNGTSSAPVTTKSASPSSSPSVLGLTSGNLPLTGSDTEWFVVAAVLILFAGRFLLVLARRRTSE